MEQSNNLPAVGFHDDDDDNDSRLIRGVKLKCLDGVWSAADGSKLKPDMKYLVQGTVTAAQLWQGQVPVETHVKEPGKPFVDVDELNQAIPVASWEIGLDGKPRPPWQVTRCVYLISIPTGKLYTSINGTFGQMLAVKNLREQVSTMRNLRGADVVPIVKLGSAPMKIKRLNAVKMRPDYVIEEYRELGGHSAPKLVEAKPEIGKPVAPVSTKEELDDEIPWLG